MTSFHVFQNTNFQILREEYVLKQEAARAEIERRVATLQVQASQQKCSRQFFLRISYFLLPKYLVILMQYKLLCRF